MSWTTIFSIFCDWRDEDGTPCPDWVAESLTKKDASKFARSRGWQTRGGHFCPKHKES